MGWQTLWRLVVEDGQEANHLRGGTNSMAWHPSTYPVLGDK